jgi:hypothetical protein
MRRFFIVHKNEFPMQRNFILISAANDKYIPYLSATLASLQPIIMHYDVGIYDLGLSESSKNALSALCDGRVTFVDPQWCRPVPNQDTLPSYKKVFLAKAFIPDFFPNYQGYVWIDADMWFPQPSAIEDYIAASDKTGFAVSYECHPSYETILKYRTLSVFGKTFVKGTKSYKFNKIHRYFGLSSALKWGLTPVMNSGIFCIRHDSAAWKHWQHKILTADLSKEGKRTQICDQTCLDIGTKEAGLLPTPMPATHNWCVELARPLLCSKTKALLDPMFPHSPIKVVHLLGDSMTQSYPLQKTDGATVETKLTAEAIHAL